MKRWIEFAAHLYPAKWQERYGPEFRALLDDVHPGWGTFFNVLAGALKTRLLVTQALYLKLSVFFAAIGILVAATISLTVPRQYISSAVIRIDPSPSAPSTRQQNSERALISAIQQLESRNSLAEIIQRPELNLYPEERLHKPFEDVIALMTRDIRTQIVHKNAPGLSVQVDFLYPDRQKAQIVVSAILSKLVSSFASGNPLTARSQNMTVVNPASLPTEPVSPNHALFLIVGFTLGILFGVLAALFIRQTRRTLLITVMGLIGCLLGAGCSLFVPDQYISTACIGIIPTDTQSAEKAAKWLQQAATEMKSTANLAELIQRPKLNLYAKERSQYSLSEVIRQLRDHDLDIHLAQPDRIQGNNLVGATALVISFKYRDQGKAQAMVAAILLTVAEKNQAATSSPGVVGTIQLLDDASFPASPSAPNRYVISSIGLTFGLVFGAVYLWIFGNRRSIAIAN